MSKAETLRGLERGLQVLDALQANPYSSLKDIFDRTGISKPSLLRVLGTLEDAGYVVRRLADGRYRVSGRMARRWTARDRASLTALAAEIGGTAGEPADAAPPSWWCCRCRGRRPSRLFAIAET